MFLSRDFYTPFIEFMILSPWVKNAQESITSS